MSRLKPLSSTIALMIATFYLSAAQTKPTVTVPKSSDAQGTLAETQWVLKSFGRTGAESSVVAGTAVTLEFGAVGRVKGTSGCNSYGSDYKVQGGQLTVGRTTSTKKACVDERANQQEQRYLKALGSASRFEVADEHLTIFYDGSRCVLNFVKASSLTTEEPLYENLNSPVDLLASYVNAVTRREYERAYRYWERPPDNLRDFARGYAETVSIQLIVQPPTFISSAAGSSYSEVPTVLVARHRNGSEHIFAGCYTVRRSNLRSSDTPQADTWRIYNAKLTAVSGEAAIPKLLAKGCRD
jgi:heat shock protein HslJ